MRKLFLTALMATALLGLAVGTTYARSFSIPTSERGLQIDWEALEFLNTVTTGVVRCHVHLEGSFGIASFPKIDRTVMGRITRAEVNRCTGGTVTARTLPWQLRYRGFGGTLPRISSVLLDFPDAAFTIETSEGLTCESNLETNNPARFRATLREDNRFLQTYMSIAADETVSLPLRGGFCGLARGRLRGTSGAPTVLGETAPPRLKLI